MKKYLKPGTTRSILLATYEEVASGITIHIHSSDFRLYSPDKHVITKQDIFEKASYGKGFKTLNYSPLFDDGPIRIFQPKGVEPSRPRAWEEDIFGD